MEEKLIIYWFRNDLRLNDNHGLYQALQMKIPVLPVFIFNYEKIKTFTTPSDIKMVFMYEQVKTLKKELESLGSSLKCFYASPLKAFEQLIKDYTIIEVVTTKGYEPYDRQLDDKVQQLFDDHGITFHRYKDRVIFEENEVVKNTGKPYTVFTPYSKKWKSLIKQFPPEIFPSENLKDRFIKLAPFIFPSLKEMGFIAESFIFPSKEIPEDIIENYALNRDYPALQGTTRLGVHLQYGTISIRQLVIKAQMLSEVFLNELIWREFFYSILWNYPEVVQHSFKPAYDHIVWRNNEDEFHRWTAGQTGFPMVDAGMRELLETGFMHNRVRMIVAGFLTRHLLIDWRWGEAWFAEKLLDHDLALNNGNWQWAAGTGCDGAPWFRIFNPHTQQLKYDPDLVYVKKWVPELDTKSYPQPIVDHQFARQRALAAYKSALRQA